MLNTHKAGLALGVFMAAVHLIWSVVVFVGMGQWWLDMVFKFHFLNSALKVVGFSWMNFVALIVMTFVVGYIGGWILAKAWNWANK